MPADNPSIAVVIPARYGSSRFPGKPLALLAGKPLIQHVYERAATVPANARVLVTTDDVRVSETVQNFGGLAVMMTDPCRTGTDRVAAAVQTLACNVVVNLQGDEIPLSPDFLMDLINPFLAGTAEMGTLRRAMGRGEEFNQSSVVKVVTDRQGRALYFSRSPIPYVRDHAPSPSSFAFFTWACIFSVEPRWIVLPHCRRERWSRRNSLNSYEHWNMAFPFTSGHRPCLTSDRHA